MRSFPMLSLLLLGLAMTLCACGGDEDPYNSADEALRTDKDYDKAVTLFQKFLDQDPKPTGSDRLKGVLGLIRAKTFNKDFDGAVASLTEWEKPLGKELTLKHYCAIINDLVNQKAVDQAIDVLTKVTKLFPEQKEELAKQAEMIKAKGASNESLERLKTLGYL